MTIETNPSRGLALACLVACVAVIGCNGDPAPTAVTEERVATKGSKKGSSTATPKPSRSPATGPGTGSPGAASASPGASPSASPAASPSAQPSASPSPSPSATPDLAAPLFEDGRVVAFFETPELTRAATREVVCFPAAADASAAVARFQLADGTAGEPATLPAQFTFDLDMATLEPGVAYALVYQGDAAAEPLASKAFTIPAAAHQPMPELPLRYRSTTLTLGPAGLAVEGEFLSAVTWRHVMVFDKDQKLVLTRHALLTARTDAFTVDAVPGIEPGEEATVYLHGDGKIVYKQTLVRAAAE